MDFPAHLFWTYILFYKYKYLKYALLFAALPDLLSWGVWMIASLFTNFSWRNHPDLSLIPKWVFTLYGITHSVIVIAAVFLIVFLIFKTIPLYLLAWPIAVIIDIFTHSREFLPTPFLWPISSWHFPGFSWGNMYFMLINYALIVISIIYINHDKIIQFFKSIF